MDTGALGASYINGRVKDWYNTQGATLIEEPLTRVCGPIKGQPCTIISSSLINNIIFKEDINTNDNMNFNDVIKFDINNNKPSNSLNNFF